METDVHQRTNIPNNGVDISLDDDSPAEYEDDYAADYEDNGELVRVPKRVLIDPGPFRYNRKVCVAALPCLLLLLMITGEKLVVYINYINSSNIILNFLFFI